MNWRTTLSWILQLMVAMILFLAAFMKLTGAPDTIQLFQALGMEPAGRILVGILEATAAILLLMPPAVAIGALLAFALMLGALIAHFSVLGVVVQNDSGLLFLMLLIVLIASAIVVYLKRKRLPFFGSTM